MPASKVLNTIIPANTSVAAAATVAGTVVDLTTKYGGWLTMQITNGGTGPTLPASFYVYTSGDNVNFKLAQVFTADVTASKTYPWAFPIEVGVMYLRVDCKDNTAQAVTAEAFLQTVTAI